MSDQRELARRAILEAAILRELGTAADETRHDLRATMQPGDRLTVGDLGAAQVTKPRRSWQVVDWAALTRWIEANAPEAIVTTTQISPSFIRGLASTGEYVTSDGEVLTPDGLGITEGTPQLRVVPTEAAHESARELLTGMRKEIER